MKKISSKVGIAVASIVLVSVGAVCAKDTIMMKFFPEVYLMQALKQTGESVSDALTPNGLLSEIDFIDTKEGIVQEISFAKKESTGMMGMDDLSIKYEMDMETLPTEMAMDVAVQIGEDTVAFKSYVAEDEIGVNLEGMDDTYVYVKGKTLSQDFNRWEVAQMYGFGELPDTFKWEGIQPLEEDVLVDDVKQSFKNWYEVNQESITIEVQEAVKKQGEKYNVMAISLDEDVVEDLVKETLDAIKDATEEAMTTQYMSYGYAQHEAEQRVREAFKTVEDEVDELDFGKGLEVECLIDSKEHIREVTAALEVANAYGEIEFEWELSLEGEEKLTDVVECVLEATSEGETITLAIDYEVARPDKDTTEQALVCVFEMDDMELLELTFETEAQVGKEKNTQRVEGSIELTDRSGMQMACDYEVVIAVDETKKNVVFEIENAEISVTDWSGVTAFTVEGEWLIAPLGKDTVKPTNTKQLFSYTLEETQQLIEDIVSRYY